MKILYAIQGTGNGHMSRAREIIPYLKDKGDLDVLVSGTEADLKVDYPVKYQLKGLSFVFGKKGGVDVYKTIVKSNVFKFINEIRNFPIEEYDLVINDFEPVSAWACKRKNKPCFALSHQYAVMNEKSPKSNKFDPFGKFVLRKYAPSTSGYGFHFREYDTNIFTPMIRSEIRFAEIQDFGHYTVYLPSYDDKTILKTLGEIDEINWHVFSKHSTQSYEQNNVKVQPIHNDLFIESLRTSSGVLCGAGFEGPTEAMYLKKKLMVIPMKNQYEQLCNAEAMKELGIPVLSDLNSSMVENIRDWVVHGNAIDISFPDITEDVINQLIEDFKNLKK